MQRMTRLEGEYHSLTQGKMNHAEFKLKWEEILMDMEQSKPDGLEIPNPVTLHRNYLSKMDATLRSVVMSRHWKLDGPGCMPTLHF